MVQPQLVEYVSSQMKLGVSRDAIKSALTGAGWMEVDVEDTLKAASSNDSAPASKPASSPASASMPGSSPMGGASGKSAEPQSVRVSDLVSASGSATSFVGGASASKFLSKAKSAEPEKQSKQPQKMNMAATPTEDMPVSRSSKGGLLMKIVGIILILGFGGAAGYFYYENLGLSTQITKLGGESNNVNAQISSLTSQVDAMTASNTALTSQITSLTAENGLLLTNLSFAAVPPLSSKTATSETVSIAGTLSSNKSSYELTTPYGVLVFVQNSKDAKVDAALKPLLTSTSSVTLGGTHVPGSQYLTVTDVNGASLAAPAGTSTTATTTTSSSTGQ